MHLNKEVKFKMVRPNYRDFRKGSQFIVVSGHYLEHSAKGSVWKDHKYIKRLDGTYYYPDNYKGGRHLPDGDNKSGKKEKESSNKKSVLEDWEKTMYDDIENTLKNNPGLFDPKKIYSDDFQDFRTTLAEFAGIDADSLSDKEVERMRKKVKDYYNKSEKKESSKKDSEKTQSEKFWESAEQFLKENPDSFDQKTLEGDVKDFKSEIARMAKVDASILSDKDVNTLQKKVKSNLEEIDNEENHDEDDDDDETIELTDNDVENLAREVLRGNFGDGQTRKDLLGDNWDRIQERVDELYYEMYGDAEISEVSDDTIEKVEKAAEKVSSSSSKSKEVDMEKVLSVYRNKSKRK